MRLRHHRRLLLGSAIVVVLTASTLALAFGGDRRGAALAVLGGHVLGDVAALTLATVVAVRTSGVARAFWALVAVGFAGWLVADGAYLARTAAGVAERIGIASDLGWALCALAMLAATGLLYAYVRPDHGWQGALDVVAVAAGLVALGWTLAAGPLGLVDTMAAIDLVFGVAYPTVALLAAAIVGWLVVRTGGGPRWLRWALAALALQFAAEITYLSLTVAGATTERLPAWILYSAAAWAWAYAAFERLHGTAQAWPLRERAAPPAWSDAVPAAAMLLGVSLLAWGGGVLGAAVFVAAAVAAIRLVATNRANARLLAERDQEALTDPLTGTLNRRSLARELSQLTARSRRSGSRFTVVAIDLDGFKSVNDARGHSEGDRLLIGIAGAIRGRLRDEDLLFRVGGDEFVALLPDTTAHEAMAAAERLRAAVAVVADRLKLDVTVSLGIAEGPTRWSPPETLLSDADAALYRAKAEGRDRAVLFPLPRQSGAGSVIP